MSTKYLLTIAAALVMILTGCGATHDETAPQPKISADISKNDAELTRPMTRPSESNPGLSEPRTEGPLSLEETLAKRRSVREFTGDPLTWEQISQLLWAAQGITDKNGWGRTAPSAGALFPLEVYVITSDGAFRYLPDKHEAEKLTDEDLRLKLSIAALAQESVRDAGADIVIAAVYERTALKYGRRAERYVEMEAGHACQNILLQAVALGLGAVPVGAFHDDRVQEILNLPEDHKPLYIVPVGHPTEN